MLDLTERLWPPHDLFGDALAIHKAKVANRTLIALARPGGHTIFTGAARIVDRNALV